MTKHVTFEVSPLNDNVTFNVQNVCVIPDIPADVPADGISLDDYPHLVERGSSVGRMPDSQSREPGFESPLLPFRSLGIFFHFTTPQSTQLYK